MTPPVPAPPLACVFEVTLACNLRCRHCGSSAGRPRERELDTREALDVIEQLAALGCRSITLSGGEPLLRRDWPDLAAAIRDRQMQPELITNGLEVADQADAIAKAAFFAVSFSIDGPSVVHDELRGTDGALDTLLKGAAELKRRRVRLGAVTQVNRLNIDRLADIHALLLRNGFEGWQVQLTMPYGRAASTEQAICLSPQDLPALEKKILDLARRSPLFIQAADNIGYFSRFEPELRAGLPGRGRVWAGCQAGLTVVGISSDGAVRGCLSMPDQLDEGNVRQRSLAQIWNDPTAFAYNRRFSTDDLEGVCRNCAFARLCRAGCTTLSFATTGGTGHNPYCLHRLSAEQKSVVP